MLALRVEYLMGRVWAASHIDRDRHEWPPHPDRLFSALVAAAEEGVSSHEARAALRWLERLPPPRISASEAAERTVVTSYVPVNDASGVSRTRQPRTFPSLAPRDPVVWFAWNHVDGADEHRPALDAVAREVVRVGHSSSVVRVTVEDGVPDGVRWLVPGVEGDRVLRVARDGRYDALDTQFAAGRRPGPGSSVVYGPERQPRAELPRGRYRELIVFALEAVQRGSPPEMRHTTALAEAVRGTLLARLNDRAPPAIHGHGDVPHVAILPLPAVGHRHADGRIHGVAIAVPDLADAVRTEVIACLAVLDGAEVWTRSGRWALVPGGPDLKTLDPRTWTFGSRWFSTVTPVMLDRFPKRGLDEDQIVVRSFEVAGYPTPTRVRVDDHSAIPGCPPAWAIPYRRPGQPPRPIRHVTVEFERPVGGPMLLGTQRHFGVGLFRSITEPVGRSFLDDQVFPDGRADDSV